MALAGDKVEEPLFVGGGVDVAGQVGGGQVDVFGGELLAFDGC